jgi:hypothetical protein
MNFEEEKPTSEVFVVYTNNYYVALQGSFSCENLELELPFPTQLENIQGSALEKLVLCLLLYVEWKSDSAGHSRSAMALLRSSCSL